MRAFPSPPITQSEEQQQFSAVSGDKSTLQFSTPHSWTAATSSSNTNLPSTVATTGGTINEASGPQVRRLHPFELKHPLQSATSAAHFGPDPHSQTFNQGFPLVGTDASAQTVYSSSPRRGWLQQQQQQHQQESHDRQQHAYQQQQHHQHQQQQQQQNSANLGVEGQYPPQSPLHQPQPINLSDHRPSSGFIAPSSFSIAQGINDNPNESASVLGMSNTFQSPLQEQSGYEGHQNVSNTVSHGPNTALSHYPIPRSHDHSGDQSEMSSMSGSNSDWNSLPNLRLQLRGMQGDLMSSTTSVQASSSEERNKGGHQSRNHLQKHLRELQAEMVDLKERVRMAEHLYHDSSSNEASSSTRSFDSAFAGGTQTEFKMDDGRVDRRAVMANRSGGNTMGMGVSAGEGNMSYPSAYQQFTSSTWRQDPYASPIQPPSGPLSNSGTSAPGRRGTWRTSETGNVLVFNTAGSSSDMEARSLTSTQRREGHGQGETGGSGVDDEGDSEGGEESNKRYECLVPGCLKTFTTSGHARRHSRTHLGHKLFVCPHDGCRSTFTRRDNCRQHQRARHHMTLPVRESTESETLESLIVDRQVHQQQNPQTYGGAGGSSNSSSSQQQQIRRPQYP